MKHLTSQRRTLLDRRQDRVDIRLPRVLAPQVLLEQLGDTTDHPQEIVKVVGNATCESTQRFHPPGLLQLLVADTQFGLRLLTARDITQNTGDTGSAS